MDEIIQGDNTRMLLLLQLMGTGVSSDEDETELAVWITAALAPSGRHRPESAAAGGRCRVPAGPPAQYAVPAASVAQPASHRHRLALDARHGALDQRPRPRSGRRPRITARLGVDHFVLRAVSARPSRQTSNRSHTFAGEKKSFIRFS